MRTVSIVAACAGWGFAAVDDAELQAARALLSSRDTLPAAKQAFERIAAADPRCAEAHRTLAHLALQRDDANDAIDHAQKAVTLAPENPDYQHALGQACGRAAQKAGLLSFRAPGLAKKCLAAFQRAVALAPENADYHLSLFDYYRQAPGFLGGGADKALDEAMKIKTLDINRGRSALVTLYTEEKKFDLALAQFDEALAAAPDDYVILFQLGRYSAQTGQFLDRGLASLHRCLELTPPKGAAGHAAVHYRLGNVHEKMRAPAAARVAYQTALQIDPSLSQAAAALKQLQ